MSQVSYSYSEHTGCSIWKKIAASETPTPQVSAVAYYFPAEKWRAFSEAAQREHLGPKWVLAKTTPCICPLMWLSFSLIHSQIHILTPGVQNTGAFEEELGEDLKNDTSAYNFQSLLMFY